VVISFELMEVTSYKYVLRNAIPRVICPSHGPPSTYRVAVSGEAGAGPRIRLREAFLRG
jgi:hypothetical protein